jgi:hypothetical protein
VSGHARIHRSLIGHPAFRNDGEAMAFAWMVLRAAWKPVRVRYKGKAISLDRGQLSVSQRDMAHALDRDKAWVERLWKRLRAEAMIEAASEAGVAVITICNYEKYQASPKKAEAADEAPEEADARQTQGTEQVREEDKKEEESSEANASGTVVPHPAMDFCKAVFDSGRAILTQNGMDGRQAGSLIGKWRKDLDDATLMVLIRQAEADGVSDPASWLTAAVATRSGKRRPEDRASYVSEGGHIYRSHDPADVMREAEKRADWTTYYAAKSDMESKRAAH